MVIGICRCWCITYKRLLRHAVPHRSCFERVLCCLNVLIRAAPFSTEKRTSSYLLEHSPSVERKNTAQQIFSGGNSIRNRLSWSSHAGPIAGVDKDGVHPTRCQIHEAAVISQFTVPEQPG